MDINKLTLIGRLTRKPEAQDTPSGQPGASFSVATNYIWKDAKTKERRDATEFHRVVAWGKLAEIVLTYLEKGSRVYLEGRLVHREWQDQNGQKRTSCDVVADEIIMLGHLGRRTSESEGEKSSDNELVVEDV